VPLLSQSERPLGVVQLHTVHGGRRFTAADLDVLVSVAITTAMALENASLHENQLEQERLQRELQLARDVQRRFLPAGRPLVEGYSFFSHYDAAYSVGGDYYSFIDLPDERLAIAIGDVSGKGMAAAMMMARLSSDVRFSMISSADPSVAMQSINLSLGEAEIEDKFITLLLMILDRKRHELSITNAGHLYPLLRRSGGAIEEVGNESAGFPLNVSPDPDYQYKVTTLSMEPGSVLVAYTDGVTDMRNHKGEWYGAERLLEVIRRAPPEAEAMGQAVLEDVSSFGEGSPQKDDLTLVVISRDAG
jgi:serine phosphatase RsbU (regulator of sigma subunit)